MSSFTALSKSCNFIDSRTLYSATSTSSRRSKGLCGIKAPAQGLGRRILIRAATDDKEGDIEALENLLLKPKGKKGGGTRNLNKKVAAANDRNLERREAGGAFFASPEKEAGSSQAADAPKATGPFGLDVIPNEFKQPDGWGDMGGPEKLWNVWASEGGMLENMNKLATGLCVFMGLCWILFRFVGPILGLYELEEGFNDTPNIGI
mmetsp:Transcript_28733/g.39707  ORF Transcript_28733/g.39707 Transcript_28733/m.39707 type:complete len:206 (-) Transcript_28733:184-801(-)|eukprot:CAMPEP_0196580282 /NCGR_PEP_ID=MMETSP1081-20130531/28255_1 /TAXON_ID=36882 /ORGANISM="Pyramimonas amylifera, Strain CCMP720" /LENGTH=205 /DNA_ID=CAMNT_0041900115 /DNA_START=132 /DNA_END=749 /DNA_ORIENTATION=+